MATTRVWPGLEWHHYSISVFQENGVTPVPETGLDVTHVQEYAGGPFGVPKFWRDLILDGKVRLDDPPQVDPPPPNLIVVSASCSFSGAAGAVASGIAIGVFSASVALSATAGLAPVGRAIKNAAVALTGTAIEVASGSALSGSDSVWTTLSVMSVVNPMNYGAAGNGTTNDTTALNNTIAALPTAGGIVYLPTGKSFKKTAAIVVTKEHVKFWAPNRQAEIFAATSGDTDEVCALRGAGDGFGVFGVKFRGDATIRKTTLDDCGLATSQGVVGVEIVGCEVTRTAATGIFLYGSDTHYLEGNYIYNTGADHIHHTQGARNSWCWENWISDNGVIEGDDGIACVSYDNESISGAMEWWTNVHLGSVWGRGYTVVGGELINIHDNWAIATSAAGICIATELSYDTHTCQNITIARNYVTECAHTIGHPGILISGQSVTSGPIANITLTNNISAANTGSNYTAQGSYTGVTNTGLDQNAAHLPTKPAIGGLVVKDTSILKTRDTSHVTSGSRPGLYRIHVRLNGATFQQRFEYVVKGTPSNISAWVATRTGAGDYLSEQQTVSGTAYALLLCAAPVTLGTGVTAVTHADLRAGDQIGSTALSWLWARINNGTY